MSYKYIEVKSFDGEVVKRLDVSNHSERSIDKIEMGLSHNINSEKYYTHAFESETSLPIILTSSQAAN